DLALLSSGAELIPTLTSNTKGLQNLNLASRLRIHLFGVDFSIAHIPSSRVVFQEDPRIIGKCWTFEGSRGHIAVALAERVTLSSMVIYRPPHHVLPPGALMTTARKFVLWGLVDGERFFDEFDEVKPASHFHQSLRPLPDHILGGYFARILEYEYQLMQAKYIQVAYAGRDLSKYSFQTLVIEVADNWGANETCIYRIGIHGN
ncbi:hypothetical protein EDD18DRAFT_1067285, partial [Armillaria luteobubalina]